METLAINTARWFRALYIGVGACLVGGSMAAFAATGDEGGRWMALLVLGGAGVACVWFAFTNGRRLTLEQEGIRGRPFGLVRWSDVQGVSVRRINFNRMLALEVREPARYYERLPRWRRSLWKISQRAGFGDISFDITGFHIGSDELVRIVRARATANPAQPSNTALNPTGVRPAG